jgi:hypothetical protein
MLAIVWPLAALSLFPVIALDTALLESRPENAKR